MNRRLIVTMLAALSVVQNSAYAQTIDDLPGFDDVDITPTVPVAQTPVVTTPVEQTPVDTAPVQTQYAGSVSLNTIPRKSGGTLHTLRLSQALTLLRLDLRVTNSKVKIHKTNLVTEQGQRIDVRQLSQTDVLTTGSVSSSENLTANARIAAIEILAESYSAEADVMLTAIASNAVPKMTVTVEQVAQPVEPTRPSTPAVPAPPPPPGATRPDPYRPPVYEDNIIRVGDEVLYARSYPGVVTYISGTEVRVRLNGYGETRAGTSDVAKSVRCLKGICVGDEGLYGGSYKGTVVKMYSNALMTVRLQAYGNSIVAMHDFAKAQRCLGAICQGDAGLYAGAYRASVLGAFDNGMLELRINGSVSIAMARDFSKSSSCNRERTMCAGADILYAGSYPGRALEFYENGMMSFQLDGYSGSSSSYTRDVAYSVRDNRIGRTYLYSGYYRATVIAVYSNGMARVTLGGYSGSSIVRVNDLR
ncbi:beta-sandwich domain-containing protein [Bdellovibrio bacteriovorus]|uniref:beta-sandwich domain-containing protein n=1 Tax=Bdellovibrio bacteriovorus TaxID=959 RepID=UPI0035A5CC10